jgi:oxygen-dependent protoporphyrinogen oxidase
MRGLRASRPPNGAKATPMLLSIAGGLERLVDRLRAALERVEVHTGTQVVSVTRQSDGRYRLLCEHGAALVADGVVLAVPAWAAARILRAMAPELSSLLEALAYASVTTVLLAYAASAFPRPLDGSGFLVPRIEGRLLTACTVCTTKWPHVRASDTIIVRCSAGRCGDERALHLDDDALVEQIHRELIQALGVQERPCERMVTRWPQAIPQYETGHQARVAEIETALTLWPGLVLAGASYHGVGIASCIQDGTRAAASLQAARQRAPCHERLFPGGQES